MANKPFTSSEYSSLGQDVLFFLEIFEPKTLQIRQFWEFSNRVFERNSTLKEKAVGKTDLFQFRGD
jgi:hypothetical protein